LFAEARAKHSGNFNCCVAPVEDYPWCRDKDIVYKTSKDGGKTWSALHVLFESTEEFFYSNISPVLDAKSTDIIAPFSRCHYKEYYSNCTLLQTTSKDGGDTWSSALAMPEKVAQISGITGVPVGPQLANGRMLYTYHFHTEDSIRANCFYTDDRGSSWQVSHDFPAGENQVAQLPNGTLIMTSRLSGRFQGYSHDNGFTWGTFSKVPSLPDVDCQGSIIHSRETPGGALLFSGVARVDKLVRYDVTVYSSKDGENWRELHRVYNGPSAYSCLLEAHRGVFVFYENGDTTPYERISMQRLV